MIRPGLRMARALRPGRQRLGRGKVLAARPVASWATMRAPALPLIVQEVCIHTGLPIGLGALVHILHLPKLAEVTLTFTDLFKFSALRRLCPGKLFCFDVDEIDVTGGILGGGWGFGPTGTIIRGRDAVLDGAIRAGQIDHPQPQVVARPSSPAMASASDPGTRISKVSRTTA